MTAGLAHSKEKKCYCQNKKIKKSAQILTAPDSNQS